MRVIAIEQHLVGRPAFIPLYNTAFYKPDDLSPVCRQSLMAYSDQEASEPNTVKPPGPSDRAASDRAHGNAATEHSPAGRAKLQPTPEKRPENQKSQPSPKKMAMLLPALQDQGRGADRERSAVALDLVAPSEDSNEGEGPSATAPPRAAGNKCSYHLPDSRDGNS